MLMACWHCLYIVCLCHQNLHCNHWKNVGKILIPKYLTFCLVLSCNTITHCRVQIELCCRDVVQEWFTARREMDGLPDNPRLAKKAAAAAGRTDAQQSILTFTPQQQQRQQQPVPQAALDRLTVKQLQAQHSPAAAAAAAAAGPAVSRLTARDLATLRSSLPSPKKFKGAKLSEELGIKEGESAGLSSCIRCMISTWFLVDEPASCLLLFQTSAD